MDKLNNPESASPVMRRPVELEVSAQSREASEQSDAESPSDPPELIKRVMILEEALRTMHSVYAGEHERLDTLRSRVVNDIVERDRARLVDVVDEKLTNRWRTTGHIANIVGKELSDRLKSIGAIAGVLALIIGTIGVTSLFGVIRTRAEATSRDVVDRQLGIFENELSSREKRFSMRADQHESAFRGAVADALDRYRDEGADLIARLDAAKAATMAAMANAASSARLASDRQMIEIEAHSAKTVEEAKEKINAQEASVVASLQDRVGRSLVAITEARESGVRAIGEATDASLARVERRRPLSGWDGSSEVERAATDSEKNALIRLHSREYQGVIVDLESAEYQENHDLLRSFTAIIQANPDAFSAQSRMTAYEVVSTHVQDELPRYNELLEFIYVAARSGHSELGKRASADLKETSLYLLTDTTFEDFGIAMTEGAGLEELNTKFNAIDPDSLKVRGLLNVLSVGKAAGIEERQLAEVERRALTSLREGRTRIARNYPMVYLAASTLVAEPRSDVAGIRRELQAIVSDPGFTKVDRDPWDVLGLIGSLADNGS